VTFFCAVKRIINTSPAAHKLARQEYSVFLDWYYYHEALAEFTVRHWALPYKGCGFAPIPRSASVIDRSSSKVDESIGCSTDVLELIVYACRRAMIANFPEIKEENGGMERAVLLEKKITKAVGDYGPIHIQSATPEDRNSMVSDLHRIACLIYVNRAVHRVSGTEFHHKRLVREGIMLLTAMATCQNAWPLFIVACEAVDDNQRLAIIDVFEQSLQDRRRRTSHIHFIQHMVEAVWKQHDLNEDKQVDYLTTFDAVVGGLPFRPLFA